MKRFKKT